MGTHADEADQREVPVSKVNAWAKKRNVSYFDASSKTGAGVRVRRCPPYLFVNFMTDPYVQECFEALLSKIIEKRAAEGI